MACLKMKSMVSIITVTYNCELLIEKTILSSIGQSYGNKEIIIIDGQSSDKTLDIVRRYQSKIAVIISEKDDGIFSAMNKGIEVAKGDWVIFMNAGDIFESDETLYNQINFINDDSLGVIYSSHLLRFRTKIRMINDTPFFDQKGKYRTLGFSHQSCLVRRSLANKYGFEEGLTLSADYKMLWSIYYEENIRFQKGNGPFAVMDDDFGATISNYKRHLIEECQISGYKPSLERSLFIEFKYFEFRLKRLIKGIIFH